MFGTNHDAEGVKELESALPPAAMPPSSRRTCENYHAPLRLRRLLCGESLTHRRHPTDNPLAAMPPSSRRTCENYHAPLRLRRLLFYERAVKSKLHSCAAGLHKLFGGELRLVQCAQLNLGLSWLPEN